MTPNCRRCKKPLVRRTAGRGQNKGNKFWGCQNYPRCKERIYDDEASTTNQPGKSTAIKEYTRRQSDPAPNEPDAAGKWDPDERREVLNHLYERDGGKCGICGLDMPIEGAQVEHVVPRVFGYFSVRKGGRADKSGGYYKSKMHGYNNLQIAHPHCNKHKGNKAAVKEWRHSKMPPLVVAIADNGQEFIIPWKK